MSPEMMAAASFETANDRFKESFSSWFWGSMIAATVMHFGVFAFWPELTAEDFSFDAEELEPYTTEERLSARVPPPKQLRTAPVGPPARCMRSTAEQPSTPKVEKYASPSVYSPLPNLFIE